MERNAIIAILLGLLIIAVWGFVQSRYFRPEFPKPAAPEAKREEVLPKKTEALEAKSTKIKPAPSAAKEIPKKDVFIETENYWAILTSEGAKLKQFKLKKYHDRVKQSPITIRLTDLVDEILGKKEWKPKKPEFLNLVKR